MWNLAESNKVVSKKMKMLTYKRHINSLNKIKAGLKIEQPWKPTFSLSKRLNRYTKHVNQQAAKQNQALLDRMVRIQVSPMRNTINFIPKSIPSNKENFLELKARQRKSEINNILKDNTKMVSKIYNVQSQYNLRGLNQFWKENQRYRQNIINKQYVPDYMQLLKSYQKLQKSRLSRPKTAFTPTNQSIDNFL